MKKIRQKSLRLSLRTDSFFEILASTYWARTSCSWTINSLEEYFKSNMLHAWALFEFPLLREHIATYSWSSVHFKYDPRAYLTLSLCHRPINHNLSELCGLCKSLAMSIIWIHTAPWAYLLHAPAAVCILNMILEHIYGISAPPAKDSRSSWSWTIWSRTGWSWTMIKSRPNLKKRTDRERTGTWLTMRQSLFVIWLIESAMFGATFNLVTRVGLR